MKLWKDFVMICRYCNCEIDFLSGNEHVCFQLLSRMESLRKKFLDNNLYTKKIFDHMKHLIVSSVLTKNEYNSDYYLSIRNKNNIFYNSIFGYANRDYQVFNRVLSKEYTENIEEKIRQDIGDFKYFVKTNPTIKFNYDDILNSIVKNVTRIEDIKKMIGDLFKYDNYCEQRFLLRGSELDKNANGVNKLNLYKEKYEKFRLGDIKKCIYTHKSFMSTSSALPFDRKLLIAVFTDPVFQDHFAKNIKASTKFIHEDEVLFMPDSKFMVIYFEKRNPSNSYALEAINTNIRNLKYEYFLVLLALPLYYDEKNYMEAPFISSTYNYWKNLAQNY